MIDDKRATGRTTRMVLAAYNYVLKNEHQTPTHNVEIVVHADSMVRHLKGIIGAIIPAKFHGRFDVITEHQFFSKGRGRREFTFFDHHVHYIKVAKIQGDIKQLEQQLDRAKAELQIKLEAMDEY